MLGLLSTPGADSLTLVCHGPVMQLPANTSLLLSSETSHNWLSVDHKFSIFDKSLCLEDNLRGP